MNKDEKSINNQELENGEIESKDSEISTNPSDTSRMNNKEIIHADRNENIGKVGEKNTILEVSENNVLPDTTVLQDLLNSIGFGSQKGKKSELRVKDITTEDKSFRNKDNLEEKQNELIEDKIEYDQKAILKESETIEINNNDENILADSQSIYDENIDLDSTDDNTKFPERKGAKRKLLTVSIVILFTIGGYMLWGFITEPKPPSEDVVATFSGKNLTKEELITYISSKGYKEEEHAYSEEHGFDHSKCDKTEGCEAHPIHSIDSYKQIIKMIASEKIIDTWAKEQGIIQKDEVQHDFKHLIEEVSLENLVDKVHEDQLSPDKIDKWEVQKYYDANKEKYKDKAFSEVEAEIRNILAAEKDKSFFPEYIEKLKKNATLNVNYELLKVAEPTETEMRSYYEKNKEKYLQPEKIKIEEVKINITSSEDEAKRKANEALTKINSGENFEDVAKRYSNGTKFEGYYINKGGKRFSFEDELFKLQVNDVSSILKDSDSYYIIKVVEKQSERMKTFGEALSEVKTAVAKENEDRQYELRKNEALFSIHGKTFTLGEFKEEFKELSPETQAQFASFEAKKSLIEEFIAKELLLEEVGDDTSGLEKNQEIEELKNQYITQILHKAEIDEKIKEVTDEEAMRFYAENKEAFIDPPKALISIIRVEAGTTDAAKSSAKQSIEAALKKLKDGADFSTIAKEYSSDATAARGGEYDEWIYDDSYLDPILQENIFNLQENEISDVFEYEEGYYIIQVRQKQEKEQRPFEEVKEEIKEALLDEKHHAREAELEEELFKQSQLVIYDSSLKKLIKEQTKAEK